MVATDAAGNTINYTYDNNNDLLTGVSASAGGQTVSNTYSYAHRRLTGITHNGFNYSFAYDGFNNVASTSVGNQVLSSNTYLPHNGLLSTSTYGNGDTVSYTYDNQYRTTGKSYNGQTAFTYVYDAYGNLARTTDLVNNVTYTYQYDMVGRTTGMDSTQGQTLRVAYDDKNRTDYVVSKVGGSGTKTQYVYGETGNGQKAGLIYGVKIDDQNTLSYTYDELARTSTRTLDLGTDFTTSYEYLDGNTLGSTTTLVSKMTNGNVSWIYTYDSRGNIETISKQQGSGQPVQQVKYYYDELNQLVREDSVVQNKTITYSYDTGGNITSRKEYAYTTGDLGNPTATISYGYGDSNWKDKLTNFNGSNITYDEIGNPLVYNGKVLTWQNGRQLATLGTSGLSTSYTYDDSGIRTSKTVNGTKTQYYLNGSTILTQITGDNRFDFFYDENGLLLGFSYNGAKYYYIRNLQSDIIGILDNSGNQVVSYTYDSWGKLLSIEGSAKDTIGVQNPFRYRGYYYDTETGFYYLNSRYYDPSVGRFLNGDAEMAGIGGAIRGYNLFAYCFNNPVNAIDLSGNMPKWLVGVFNIVSGGLQMAAGIILGAATSWSGVGAVAGGLLVANGAATITQGIGQIVNDVSQSNIMREDNMIRTGVQAVGQLIGGSTGGQVAGAVYDTAIVASNIYAGTYTSKVGLQQAGLVSKKVNINFVLNNPADEYVTIGPANGVISQYCRTIPQNGYGKIHALQLPNGYYQLADGHHRVAALRNLGVESIRIFLTQ